MKAATVPASINIEQAIADPMLLGAALGDASSWQSWRVVLKATFGLALDEDEARAFAAVAGDRNQPPKRVREVWAIIGRRSGKSRIAALVGTFIAALVDHNGKLAPGEVGYVLILAASKAQAGAVFNYCRAFFESSPLLRQLVKDITSEEIRLEGNIVLAVHANSHRTVRGRTLLAAVFDEVSSWRDENSAMPDVETYRAVLPALATTQGMLIGISTPHAQRGLLYNKFHSTFGENDPNVLVVKAPTTTFNPTIDLKAIADAHVEDPELAAAEWEAEFRSDLSTYIERTTVENCVEQDVAERAPSRGLTYAAACDPSGGERDSFAFAIAHREHDKVVLDLAREIRAPYDPSEAMSEMAGTLTRYRCRSVTGDAYAANWVVAEARRYGLTYRHSKRNRSQIYLDALPLFRTGQAVLLDQPRLINQIAQLERRAMRGGRDAIDHSRGAADDLANAAALALVLGYELRSGDRDHAASVVIEGLSNFNPHNYARADERHDNRRLN